MLLTHFQMSCNAEALTRAECQWLRGGYIVHGVICAKFIDECSINILWTPTNCVKIFLCYKC